MELRLATSRNLFRLIEHKARSMTKLTFAIVTCRASINRMTAPKDAKPSSPRVRL